MKNLLFVVLATLVPAALSAQLKSHSKGDLFPARLNMKQAAQGQIAIEKSCAPLWKNAARSKATGLYYYKPAGSMYETYYTEDLYITYVTTLVVPAWYDFTFTNMSTNPADTKWYINNIDYGESYPSTVDDNYNLTLSTYPAYGYYLPVLKNSAGTDSYVMGAYSETYSDYAMVAGSCEVMTLGFLDNKEVYTGFSNGDYIAGSLKFSYNNESWSTESVVQRYPAPASPLYVESATIVGVTYSEAMKDGAELTMKIYSNNGKNYYDDDYELLDLKETLTADASDFMKVDEEYGYTLGTLSFTKKVEDPIFGTVEEPFVIDYPATIYIEGFDNSNVDFGVSGYTINDCDDTSSALCDIRFMATNSSGDEREFGWTDQSMGMGILFEGMMDQIAVEEQLAYDSDTEEAGYTVVSGYNILQISDDGKECHTYGKEDTGYDFGALYVYTAGEWYDEYGGENYSYELYETTDPDNGWITSIVADDEDYSVDDGYFVNYVTFTAEALPSNITGRSAIVYLTGRGYTDSTPVVLIQGNAEVPDGINSVLAPAGTANAKTKPAGTYSVSGQRVNDNAKGLLIKDGKKVINK